jgi:hypothetical protein
MAEDLEREADRLEQRRAVVLEARCTVTAPLPGEKVKIAPAELRRAGAGPWQGLGWRRTADKPVGPLRSASRPVLLTFHES